jgi:hypothetical protein
VPRVIHGAPRDLTLNSAPRHHQENAGSLAVRAKVHQFISIANASETYGEMSWRRFLALRIRDRIARRFSISCFEESPCFVRACCIRRIPASVFGPVLRPPWSLHRPFVMAGHWHSEPRRVFALHLGAFVKSPQGLPFLSQPRPGSWGLSSLFSIGPFHRRNCPHNCSPAGIHIYVLNYDLLLSNFSFELSHEFRLLAE